MAYQLLSLYALRIDPNRQDCPPEFAYVYLGRNREEARKELAQLPHLQNNWELAREEDKMQLVPLHANVVTQVDVRDCQQFLYFCYEKVLSFSFFLRCLCFSVSVSFGPSSLATYQRRPILGHTYRTLQIYLF